MFKHAVILFYGFIATQISAKSLESYRNGLEEDARQIVKQETLQMSALYDYKSGTILFKDDMAGICLAETFEDGNFDFTSPVIIPENHEISYISMRSKFEEIANSTLTKAFCGDLPIHEVPSFSHMHSPLENLMDENQIRRKRSVGNGDYSRYPSPQWPQQGQASQTQIQGQVTGQGFFSGQAQSQQSGVSQSQVQLSGTGILGSLSSSAGNAQAQIALGRGDGSGQAGSSGVGPSNSQVQINLGQEGRGSMASASVLAGQGGQLGHNDYSKSRWASGSVSSQPKVAQHHYNGNYGSHSRGQNVRGSHFQPQQFTNQYDSTAGFPGSVDGQQYYRGYGTDQSRQYESQGTGVGQTSSRHRTDESSQINPSGISQYGQENGHQSGQRQYPETSYPGGQYSRTGQAIQQPTVSHFTPTGSLDHEASQQVVGGLDRQLAQGIKGQLQGYGASQPTTSQNNLDLGYSPQTQSGRNVEIPPYPSTSGHHRSAHQQQPTNGHQQLPTTGHQQLPTTGHQQLPTTGHQQLPTTGHQQLPTTGHQQLPTTGHQQLPTTGHQQQPTNGQHGNYGNGGRTYSPQPQGSNYGPGLTGRLPQTFASSYGSSQAQAQTVYLGPGTTDFYSPSRATYGSSSYYPSSSTGTGNGNIRNQNQNVVYDSHGRGTPSGYRTNGYRETISSNGYDDQHRSTPAGFVQPHVTTSVHTDQQVRQTGTNGHGTPAGQLIGSAVGVGRPGESGAPGSLASPTSSYGSVDQSLGSGQQARPNGQVSTPYVQSSQIPESGNGYKNQIPPQTYGSQQPRQSQNGYPGHPGTISNFLQRPQEQDGFAPSYRISQISPQDTTSQRCTIVTFTCTIIIESNGRAKICRPNAGQTNTGLGGDDTQTAQNKQAGGLCCC